MGELDYDARLDVMADEIATDARDYDMELTTMVFEEADTFIAGASVNDALAVLEQSQNEPTEWRHLTASDDWREVIRTMAFTVVRQDLYERLEREGVTNGYGELSEEYAGGGA